MEKIITALKLKIPPRDLTGEDPKSIAQAIMSKWLPCADAVLEAVAEKLPSPLEAQLVRIPKLWQTTVGAPHEITEKQKVRNFAEISLKFLGFTRRNESMRSEWRDDRLCIESGPTLCRLDCA